MKENFKFKLTFVRVKFNFFKKFLFFSLVIPLHIESKFHVDILYLKVCVVQIDYSTLWHYWLRIGVVMQIYMISSCCIKR